MNDTNSHIYHRQAVRQIGPKGVVVVATYKKLQM